MPSRPSDYPEECIPRTPDDVFYEDEEEKEGGIYEKIIEYGEEHGITYTEEQIARFKPTSTLCRLPQSPTVL